MQVRTVDRAYAILDSERARQVIWDLPAQEVVVTLNRLTLLDSDYPGLWRVKALVFEKQGNKGAAAWALEHA